VDDDHLTATWPDMDEALALVETGLERESLVTLFGRCRVDYEGRATSTLGPGDRLVVLKPDGTVLVHTDEGQQPVNWQPPGCTHEVTTADGQLVVQSQRQTPSEELLVRFDRVAHATAYAVSDPSDLALSGTEEDLRQRILDDPSLLEAGFEPRATERETPAGAVDIYGVDTEDSAVVVELKRRRAGPDAVSQLNRYVEALERDLHAGRTVRGVLVAPSVTDRAGRLLDERDLEFVALAPEPDRF
jgi:RecB family endonuclease NucS